MAANGIIAGIAGRLRDMTGRGALAFEGRDDHLRASYGQVSFCVMRHGVGRRARHVAYMQVPDGSLALLARTGSAATARAACSEALESIKRGTHLSTIRITLDGDADATSVPCVVAVTREPGGDIRIRPLAVPDASLSVRPAFVPNFMGGALARVDLVGRGMRRHRVEETSGLLAACLEAPGLLSRGEARAGKWGYAALRVRERHRAADAEVGAATDLSDLRVLAEADRLSSVGVGLTDPVRDLVALSASRLMESDLGWACLSALPVARTIEDAARWHGATASASMSAAC